MLETTRAYLQTGSTQILPFFVYWMGRLCGGAHEISGIKAPLFPHGGWLEGSWGGCVVVGWVMGWVGGGIVGPHDTPIMGVSRCPPCYFLTIWWKNLTTYHCKPTSNIDIYPSILEICINNLLKPFFFGFGPPIPTPTPKPYQRPPHLPLKIILMPNIFNKNQHIYL